MVFVSVITLIRNDYSSLRILNQTHSKLTKIIILDGNQNAFHDV